MGYDIHITRNPDWDEDGPEITLDDWKKYVESDPEMEWDPHNENMALWLAHPKIHPKITEDLWVAALYPGARGDIVAKYPDEAHMLKMLQIARHFGGKLQGDDGEIYNEAEIAGIDRNSASGLPVRDKAAEGLKSTLSRISKYFFGK